MQGCGPRAPPPASKVSRAPTTIALALAVALGAWCRADACKMVQSLPYTEALRQGATDLSWTVRTTAVEVRQSVLGNLNPFCVEGTSILVETTAREAVAFELSVVSGALPRGAPNFGDVRRSTWKGELILWWMESLPYQPAIDATLSLVFIDATGRRSPPVLVHVTDSGNGLTLIGVLLVPFVGVMLARELVCRKRARPRRGPLRQD